MSEIKGSSLFIVGSPFQCLCMLEAIDRFKLIDYDILVVYCDTRSLDKVKKLLDDRKLDYTVRFYGHIIKTVLPLIFERHKYYQNVVLGDYYGGYEALADFYAGRNGLIHYLDDGTQALEIFSNTARNRYKSFSIKLVFKLYDIIFKLKGGKEDIFFTIYPVISKKYTIIHNDFKLLKSTLTRRKEGVYIIGTNSSALHFKGTAYPVLLKELYNYIKKAYPEQSIFYCPHRRDLNNENIFELCKSMRIDIFNTEISVEYDFSMKGINPSFVVGFTSNALYTLKMIYPDSEMGTVVYHLEDQQANAATAVIVSWMNAVGIKSIDLFDGE